MKRMLPVEELARDGRFHRIRVEDAIFDPRNFLDIPQFAGFNAGSFVRVPDGPGAAELPSQGSGRLADARLYVLGTSDRCDALLKRI